MSQIRAFRAMARAAAEEFASCPAVRELLTKPADQCPSSQCPAAKAAAKPKPPLTIIVPTDHLFSGSTVRHLIELVVMHINAGYEVTVDVERECAHP